MDTSGQTANTSSHLIADRYQLGYLLSSTTLGKFFHAHDWLTVAEDDLPLPVIMLAVEPALASYPGFDKVLPRVLEEFTRPDTPLRVSGACHDGGIYWIALDETEGELLDERLSQYGEEFRTAQTIQPHLNRVLKAAKYIMPQGGIGFLEPGAILCVGDSCKLLNAPLAIALRILSSASTDMREGLNLHSAYASPQATVGIPAVSQDDTFSIGSIAYHFLRGAPAFGTFSTLEAVSQQLAPKPLTNLKPEAWDSLRRALSLQRQPRQTSPYELVHAFTVIPGSDPVTDFKRPHTVFPKAAILGSILLLAAVMVFSLYGLRQEPATEQPARMASAPDLVAVTESAPKLPFTPTAAQPFILTETQTPPVIGAAEKVEVEAKPHKVEKVDVTTVKIESKPQKVAKINVAASSNVAPERRPAIAIVPPPQANRQTTTSDKPAAPSGIRAVSQAKVAAINSNTFVVKVAVTSQPPAPAPAPQPEVKLIQTGSNTFIVAQD